MDSESGVDMASSRGSYNGRRFEDMSAAEIRTLMGDIAMGFYFMSPDEALRAIDQRRVSETTPTAQNLKILRDLLAAKS